MPDQVLNVILLVTYGTICYWLGMGEKKPGNTVTSALIALAEAVTVFFLMFGGMYILAVAAAFVIKAIHA